MLERSGQILKIACLILVALVLYKVAKIAPDINPLAGVVIPGLPTLDETNTAVLPGGTNKPVGVTGTNSPTAKTTNAAGSNIIGTAQGSKTNTAGTNNTTHSTNAPSLIGGEVTNTGGIVQTNGVITNALTNLVEMTNVPLNTNVVVETNNSLTNILGQTNVAVTNVVLTNFAPTNLVSTNSVSTNAGMTNLVQTNFVTTNLTSTNISSTNLVSTNKSKSRATNGPPTGARASARMNPGGMAGPDFPPDIKARLDRIYESEILGQIIRPQPMGLMGIAGNFAFLRSPTGQTGMVKEGDSLGDLKLLRIGTNRVLVEADGKKQELMIFEGYGGESLLPKEKETPK